MKRPGTLLLLLRLTSAATVLYRWQADVSLLGSAVQTTSAVSMVACGLRCERRPLEECNGFIYDAGNGTCRLFSGDCRGPAASCSKQTTDRYMARTNPSEWSQCRCPGLFLPCAGRCYRRIDVTESYSSAKSHCEALLAHLAVPRTDEENVCTLSAAAGQRSWLGVHDRAVEGKFVGDDGGDPVCDQLPYWKSGQPNNHGNEDCVWIQTAGWRDFSCSSTSVKPLCQTWAPPECP